MKYACSLCFTFENHLCVIRTKFELIENFERKSRKTSQSCDVSISYWSWKRTSRSWKISASLVSNCNPNVSVSSWSQTTRSRLCHCIAVTSITLKEVWGPRRIQNNTGLRGVVSLPRGLDTFFFFAL